MASAQSAWRASQTQRHARSARKWRASARPAYRRGARRVGHRRHTRQAAQRRYYLIQRNLHVITTDQRSRSPRWFADRGRVRADQREDSPDRRALRHRACQYWGRPECPYWRYRPACSNWWVTILRGRSPRQARAIAVTQCRSANGRLEPPRFYTSLMRSIIMTATPSSSTSLNLAQQLIRDHLVS